MSDPYRWQRTKIEIITDTPNLLNAAGISHLKMIVADGFPMPVREVKIQMSTELAEQGYLFEVFDNWLGCLVSFKILRYPKCCAMMQMVDFQHSHSVSEEWLFSFLDSVFKDPNWGFWFTNRRIMIAMVEHRGDVFPKGTLYTHFDKNHDVYLKEYEEIENPVIHFPLFHKYFKKQKVCRTSLMPNINSGMLIHLIEAILL